MDTKLVDRRRTPRHGIVWADEWDTPRFRLLTPIQRCLYITITQYAGRTTGACWPKQATLARIVACDIRTVERGIKRLVQLEYLTVVREEHGARRVNTYTLCSPPATVPGALPPPPDRS